MLLDLNQLADSLIEEALTTGKITLQNKAVYTLKTSDLLRIISFIKRNRPVSATLAKRSVLPDDFDLDDLLLGTNDTPLDDRLP